MIIDGDILDQIKYWLAQQHTLTRDTSEAIALLWAAHDEMKGLREGKKNAKEIPVRRSV